MSKLIIFSILSLMISMVSRAADQPDEKWFRCAADNDCVEIKYPCTDAVINEHYLKEANEFYQLENARMECIQIPPTEAQKKIPYKVFCKSNKCGSQGVNPKKPGFS